MNQEDFRKLVASSHGTTSRNERLDGNRRKGKNRIITSNDMDEIRQLSAKKGGKGRAKESYERRPEKNMNQPSSIESQYRDRAAERRMKGIVEENDGKDVIKAPHVVKGLDFALLAQLKQQKEELQRATAAERHKQSISLSSETQSSEVTFKTRMGRLIYYHISQGAIGHAQPTDRFVPGHMHYTFSLAVDSLPIAVQRSKDECGEVDACLSGRIYDQSLLTRITEIMGALRMGQHHSQIKKTSSESVKKVEEKVLVHDVEEEDDDDIFPDAEEYVPVYLREETSEINMHPSAHTHNGYFTNLSAASTAAEQAEREREEASTKALNDALAKAAAAQAEMERQQARAAKLAAAREYSEYDDVVEGSDSDGETKEGKRRKGKKEKNEVDEDEVHRRKKQKHQNKMEHDLQKIQQLMESKRS